MNYTGRRVRGTWIRAVGTIGLIDASTPHIGTLNEGSLHAALKHQYAGPGDRFETAVDGMVVDLVQADGRLVEVQTGSLAALGPKLDRLLEDHRILVVHPIAVQTILVRAGKPDRKSPTKGKLVDVFEQLVSVPTLLDHPNLTIDVPLIVEERVKIHDPKLRRRRGGWRTVDRRLVEILDIHRFSGPDDLDDFVPVDLPPVFTTADMAASGQLTRDEAQRIAYCMRALDRFVVEARSAKGYEYRWSR